MGMRRQPPHVPAPPIRHLDAFGGLPTTAVSVASWAAGNSNMRDVSQVGARDAAREDLAPSCSPATCRQDRAIVDAEDVDGVGAPGTSQLALMTPYFAKWKQHVAPPASR
jgi:hypothetical protein